jgi:hypothetical protein
VVESNVAIAGKRGAGCHDLVDHDRTPYDPRKVWFARAKGWRGGIRSTPQNRCHQYIIPLTLCIMQAIYFSRIIFIR